MTGQAVRENRDFARFSVGTILQAHSRRRPSWLRTSDGSLVGMVNIGVTALFVLDVSAVVDQFAGFRIERGGGFPHLLWQGGCQFPAGTRIRKRLLRVRKACKSQWKCQSDANGRQHTRAGNP